VSSFKTPEDVYASIGAFLQEITQDPTMRPKFVSAQTSFRVTYTNPDAVMVVDCTQDPPVVTLGDTDAPAEIDLKMSAEDGHAFWMGKLNMTVALAKKRVQVAGPMSKMMKLLPAMRPAFPKYREFLADRGMSTEVSS
jgi:putative sterol carrier protein